MFDVVGMIDYLCERWRDGNFDVSERVFLGTSPEEYTAWRAHKTYPARMADKRVEDWDAYLNPAS